MPTSKDSTIRRERQSWTAWIGLLLSIAVAFGGALVSYGALSAKSEHVQVEVEKVEERHRVDVDRIEKETKARTEKLDKEKVDKDRFEDLRQEVGAIKKGIDEVLRRLPQRSR